MSIWLVTWVQLRYFNTRIWFGSEQFPFPLISSSSSLWLTWIHGLPQSLALLNPSMASFFSIPPTVEHAPPRCSVPSHSHTDRHSHIQSKSSWRQQHFLVHDNWPEPKTTSSSSTKPISHKTSGLSPLGQIEYDIFRDQPGDDCDWFRGEHHVHRLCLHQACLCSHSPQCFQTLLPHSFQIRSQHRMFLILHFISSNCPLDLTVSVTFSC